MRICIYFFPWNTVLICLPETIQQLHCLLSQWRRVHIEVDFLQLSKNRPRKLPTLCMIAVIFLTKCTIYKDLASCGECFLCAQNKLKFALPRYLREISHLAHYSYADAGLSQWNTHLEKLSFRHLKKFVHESDPPSG